MLGNVVEDFFVLINVNSLSFGPLMILTFLTSEQRYNINVLKARNVKYRIESLFVYYMQKDLNIINYSYWKKYQYLCSSSSSSRRVMLLRSMACQA